MFALHAQNTPFPYHVQVTPTVGNCLNNCGAIVTLLNQNGQVIAVNDSLHHPVDSILYNMTEIQYHYKNQNYNSVFYSEDHVLTMDAGTYDIGVSGYITVQNGSGTQQVQVDTTIYGVVIISAYVPLNASSLATIAQNNDDYYFDDSHVVREYSGNRNTLPCVSLGRLQLKLQNGNFPYTVDLINGNDTVRHVVFHERQNHGTDSIYADFRDYYTFDSLAAGTYRVVVQDACSYTIVMHHTVETTTVYPQDLYYFRALDNYSDSNIVRFTIYFYQTAQVYNYDHDVLENTFQYRFINPSGSGQHDTTAWMPINWQTVNYMYEGLYNDTVASAHSYCDIYDQPITFQVRDLCGLDTFSLTITLTAPLTEYYSSEMFNSYNSLTPIIVDTCHLSSDQSVYKIDFYRIHNEVYPYNYPTGAYNNDNFLYTLPLYWIYRDSLTHQIIKTDTIYSITEWSLLTCDDITQVYGPYQHLDIPIIRTLVGKHGCELFSTFDTLTFIMDTISMEQNYTWRLESNFNQYNYSNCFFNDRYIAIYEEGSPFPQFRDSVSIRLVTSPLYNKYNFTATYHNGEWTIVKADSVNNDADIIIGEGLSLSIHSNRLSGGKYVFVYETACGQDSLTIDIQGIYYYDWQWEEDAVYQTFQECNNLYITPISGLYRQNIYHIDTEISNDEPLVDTYLYSPNIHVFNGEVGGYSSPYVDMNGTITFTIPGDYVMEMYFYGCGEEYTRYDTIHFVRVRIDFDKAYAVVCDSASSIGSVFARAINGSQPYTYTLYSEPDMHGTCLGSNNTGTLNNMNFHLGQELSLNVIDSCENSYYINLVAMALNRSRLLWFEEGEPNPGACVDDTVRISALQISDDIGYFWTGPNNFTSTNRTNDVHIPYDGSSGFFVLELLNTGCQYPVKDSVYLHVLTAPRVLLSAPDSVCAGETITLNVVTEGAGTISYDLHQSYLDQQSHQSMTCNGHDSLTIDYTVYSEQSFWADQIHDNICAYKYTSDTVNISIKPYSALTDSSHIIAPLQIGCYNQDMQLSASSDLSFPYIINWYSDFLQNNLIQQDTITHEQEIASIVIPTLTHDTTVYAMSYNSVVCPSRYNVISGWLNMRNGTSQIHQGEGIRLYDSGGWNQNYQNNENYTHTFVCPTAEWILLRFNSFRLLMGDSLFIYSGADSNITHPIAVYTDTLAPTHLFINGGEVTIRFTSNALNTNAGWSLDILTAMTMKEVQAEVIRHFDTLSTITCQSDTPFDYDAFHLIDVSQAGLFELDTILYSQMGCDSSIHLAIQVLPKSFHIIDTKICEGEKFNIGDHSYSENGNYQTTIEAANGCDSIVTLHLEVTPNTAEITSEYEDFCEQYMTILSFHGEGTDIQWSTGEQTQDIVVTAPGTYMASSNLHGCIITGMYTIPKCDFPIYLPNTITPSNHDGLNDYFALNEKSQLFIQDFEIAIFSRWGEQIYYSTDKNFKWYGEYNGYTYQNTLYNYVVTCTDKDGQKHLLKGSILVL